LLPNSLLIYRNVAARLGEKLRVGPVKAEADFVGWVKSTVFPSPAPVGFTHPTTVNPAI
jgi:hypothetical protein